MKYHFNYTCYKRTTVNILNVKIHEHNIHIHFTYYKLCRKMSHKFILKYFSYIFWNSFLSSESRLNKKYQKCSYTQKFIRSTLMGRLKRQEILSFVLVYKVLTQIIISITHYYIITQYCISSGTMYFFFI